MADKPATETKAAAPVAPQAQPVVAKAAVAPKAEPAKAEPAKAEPAKVEAAKVDTPKIDAAKAETAKPVAAAPVMPVAATPVVAPKASTAAAKIVAPKAAPAKTIAKPVAKTITKPTTKPTPQPVAAKAAVVTKKEITMESTIKNVTEKTQAQAKAMFADVNDRAKTAMEKGTQAFEQMNDFNKGNIEALVESGKIAAKGMEAMGQEAAEYSRKSFETATAALKSLSSVKSPTDFFKLHSDYVRQSFDSIVAETSKNTEAMLKLAGEVAQPISNRVAVAVEKVKIAA